MEREYLRVRPSSEPLAPRDIPATLASLRKLMAEMDGVRRFLFPGKRAMPTFEFLALSAGADAPVEFYYGTEANLDTLAKRLRSIYPPSFDIDRVTIDPVAKLLQPVEYDRETFRQRARNGRLYHDVPTAEDGDNADIDGDIDRYWLGDEEDAPAVGVAPPDALDARAPATAIDEPTATHEGTVLARPPVDAATPYGVEWLGFASRKRDWMTTLQEFSDLLRDEDAENAAAQARAPLAPLIEHLTEAPEPMAFQVVFQRKDDWSADANRRKAALASGQDTLTETLLTPPNGWYESTDGRSRRRQRESSLDSTPSRQDLVEANDPDRTFTVNLRALALPVEDEFDEDGREALERQLDAMKAAFDPLDGPYYGVTGRRLRTAGALPTGRRATKTLKRFRKRSVETTGTPLPSITNHRDSRPDLVLNPEELANFVVVPSGSSLSQTADRGTRAEQESRDPLPLPTPEVLDQLDGRGIALGRPLDETGDPLEDPVWLPPDLQRYHVGRFAKTGGGKSVALINDALSLYETTDGPVFILDTKGGGLPENYLRAHAARFGMEDLEANVLHFPIPEVLPGLAPLNIEPRLEAGTPREQAVSDVVRHYEEFIRLVMGRERYERAVVAPVLLRSLVRVMFDEEYGLEHGAYRNSVDYCTQSQLEQTLDQLIAAGPPNPRLADAPQSGDDRLQARFERQLQTDPNTFANVTGAVGNRLDYITADPFLRQVFDNTEPRFDFRELLDENTVVIFDLGELRSDPATVMASVLLTSLLDAVKDRDPEAVASNDDYIANLLIDEAAAVAVSDVLNDLLERGREFGLSVELVTQFPKQLELAGDREVFLNLLTNVDTKLVGPLSVDDELAKALAHEDMDPTEFHNRVRALPRGEWIAQVPSPEFQATGPLPFSLEAMPVPGGHPDSDERFEGATERRFQDAVERVHDRTAEEYGVPEGVEDQPPVEPPAGIRELLGDAADFETAMARIVRQVQLQTGERETNGPVPVERVDDLLRECVAAADGETEPPSYETLTEVREASGFVEVGLSNDAERVVCSLTEAGERVAAPTTGEVEAAGGAAHDAALERVERVLADEGFLVNILEQDRSSMPDARAVHPELTPTFAVEVETTTVMNPVKVLRNLQRAQESGDVPLFVVEAGAGDREPTYWAERLEGILSEPINRQASGEERLYLCDEPITFGGGATAEEGVTAVRPTTDGSRETVWRREGDAFALADPSGTEFVRVPNPLAATRHQFPAVVSHDPETETHVVRERGERHVYESEEAFEAEWVPVKRPFVPEQDLPAPEYGSDSYAVLILGDGPEESVVGIYEVGGQYPTDLLLADRYQPATARDSGGAESPPEEADTSDGNDTEPEDLVLAAFVAGHLEEHEDAVTPSEEVYGAFETWATTHDLPVPSKRWFTRRLSDHVSFERDRRWIDGETVRCYAGVALAERATQGDDDG